MVKTLVQYTSSELQQQVVVAKSYVGKPGGITQAQFNDWNAKQQVLIQQAQAKESTSSPYSSSKNPNQPLATKAVYFPESKPVPVAVSVPVYEMPQQNPNTPLPPDPSSIIAKGAIGTKTVNVLMDPKAVELKKIAEENKRFIEARDKGEITGKEYNTAIYFQYQKARAIDPSIPEGMIVSNVDYNLQGANVKVEPLTYVQQGISLFGVFDPNTAAKGMYGEDLPYIYNKDPNAPKELSPSENRALSGLTLATIVAAPVSAPSAVEAAKLVAGSAGGVGAAEVGKYTLTGKHLTPEEAINAAALGQGAVYAAKALNSKVLKPKVTEQLSKSYDKTLDTGKLWEPSVKEQVAMKVTGAKPNSATLKVKATDMLSDSYMQQAKLNESILMGKPMPENIAGRTGMQAWTPTAKEAEMMALTGAKPKIPAPSVNVARVAGGDVYSMTGLQRQFMADDLFDFSVAPKTSFQSNIIAEAPKNIDPRSYSSRLPFFAPSSDIYGYKMDLQRLEQAELERQSLIDKSQDGKFPSNQLDYDYRGPLYYKKPPSVPKTLSTNAKPIEVTSTKNIKTFDALMMAKNVAKQGKPLTQLRDGAAWGEGGLLTLQKNVNVFNEPLITSALPKTLTPTVQTSRAGLKNPFLMFTGKSYYAQTQKVTEEYEQQYLTMPGQVAKLTPKSQSKVIQKQPLTFQNLWSNVNQYPSTNQPTLALQQPKQGIKNIVVQEQQAKTIKILDVSIGQKPYPNYPSPTAKANPNFSFNPSGLKINEGGPNMFFTPARSRLGKAIRYYPVTPPKKLLRSVI